MALSDFRLVREANGLPTDFVWLTCVEGDQTHLVSISRADVDDFAQQKLPRAEQDALVEKNLETLAPIITVKRDRGELGQQPMPNGTPRLVLQLSRADLEHGMRRHWVSSSTGPSPVEWVPQQAGTDSLRARRPSRAALDQASTPLPLIQGAEQRPPQQPPVMSAGAPVSSPLGSPPDLSIGATDTGLPVQSYLVTTPLNFPNAALVSLTLRFGEGLHNLLPEHVAAALDEEFEGWVRVPMASSSALLDRLATTGSDLNPSLRAAIIEALDERAAVLQFSLPTPFRIPDLQRLRTGILGFSKVSPARFFVGVLVAGTCIIALQVAWGIGSGLRTTADYAVTQIGEAVVDRIAQRLRAGDSPPR
jgi:hypothetical protein